MGGVERRKYPRRSIIIDIEYISESPPMRARISDISEGGVFVDTMNPLSVGASVRFKFHLTEDQSDQPIIGDGVVTWTQPPVGMGIKFIRMRHEDWERIRDFLKTLV